MKVFITDGKYVQTGKLMRHQIIAIGVNCIEPEGRDGSTFTRRYTLYLDGTYTMSRACIRANVYVEANGTWCNRYHYKEALTVLCIGKYSEMRSLIGYDPWRIIARIESLLG
jgi:hypothetical protein